MEHRDGLPVGGILYLLQHGSGVLQASCDARHAIFGALVFQCQVAVIAGLSEDPQALLYRDISFTHDGTAEIIAAPGHVFAVAGGGRADQHIFQVCMDGIRRHPGHSCDRIFVDTDKVADIHKKTVVIMVYSVEQPFYPVAVLSDIAVIFGAGANAQCLGIFGDPAAMVGSIRSKERLFPVLPS